MLLVRGDLDVMRADGGLDLVRVVEALGVFQIRNVKGGNMVGRCERDYIRGSQNNYRNWSPWRSGLRAKQTFKVEAGLR